MPSWRRFLVTVATLGLVLLGLPTSAGATHEACHKAPVGTGFSLVAINYDTISRFDSGRLICATAMVEYNFEAAFVNARMEVFAIGTGGNIVPGIFYVEDYQLRYANCTAGGSCGGGTAFTRCSPTPCRIQTTGSNRATFVGVPHDATVPYGANTSWRTRANKVRGTIINTSDFGSNHCVSSSLWRYGSNSVIGGPSC